MRDLSYDELIRRLAFSERQRNRMRKAAARTTGEADGTNWSITDLMTLLLIFFILLYARSGNGNLFPPRHADPVPVSPRIVRHKIIVPSTPAAAKAVLPAGSPTPAISKKPAATLHPSSPEANPLEMKVKAFMKANAGQGIRVRWEEKRPVFVLSEKITFLTGQADLLAEFQPALVRMADFIAEQEEQQVQVTGHTDDTPISTFQFPSNWELSASRAASVARFLIANGVSAERIIIQGKASFRPVAPNDTTDHRQANRRVEITLIER
jgi:chemotaxis protein MotB